MDVSGNVSLDWRTEKATENTSLSHVFTLSIIGVLPTIFSFKRGRCSNSVVRMLLSYWSILSWLLKLALWPSLTSRIGSCRLIWKKNTFAACPILAQHAASYIFEKQDETHQERLRHGGIFIPWNSREFLNLFGMLTWNTGLKRIRTMRCLLALFH